MVKEKLKFYDLAKKKSFTTTNWKKVVKNGRVFAVAKTPSGKEAWRIMGRK